MMYLLLAAGVGIGGFGLYRFLLVATPRQVGTLIVIVGTLTVTALVFLLAISGRLPGVMGALAASWPLFYSLWKSHQQVRFEERVFDNLRAVSPQMTESEALSVLGLKPGASADDIDRAYKNLMKKFHPDRQGSEWIAHQINRARDILLKK